MYTDELLTAYPAAKYQVERKMYPLKRILVALDNSDADDALIEYASFAAQASDAEMVYFVNIIKETKIPEGVLAEFPDLLNNAIKDRVKGMREKIEHHFDLSLGSDIKFEVKEGQPAKQNLRLADKYNIDSILVALKQASRSSNVLVQRLARRAKCSLMIVPDIKYSSMRKLMVANDLSENSLIALEEAIAIAEQHKENAEIICHHVYSVPTGYHYTGKTYEEFAKVMRKNSQKEFEKFIQKVDTKGICITPLFTLDDNDNPVDDIYKAAIQENVDCILVGGKGKSAATSFFMIGNTTEKLVNSVSEVPLLLVRPKHEDEGIIDYLKKF
jgi:nucleotide-binding universal stress UspA family protein